VEKDQVINVLKKNGFSIYTVESKLDKDLEALEGEMSLIKMLERHFRLSPNTILEHPMYGVIDSNHSLLTKMYKSSLVQKEKELLKEIREYKMKEKKSTMRDKLSLVEEDSNVVNLF
jgi:hypothetical protein